MTPSKPMRLGRSIASADVSPGRDRKAEHLRLALDPSLRPPKNWFDEFRFEHSALPEMNYEDIDVSCRFLGRKLAAPILISCMTGGTEEATRINRNLAIAAETIGIAVGVGSQRKALEDPSTIGSFRIRPFAPSVPILANLGAVQLNYGFGIDECRRAVEMIEADALVLHLNPLQEAIQPEGQRNFAGLLDKIGKIARNLGIPVIVKEVGCGISRDVATRLLGVGVTVVDTAGSGGTSWARIEASRAGNAALGDLFADWGIPTPIAIGRLRGLPGLTVIGSGGIRHGVDIAKAIAAGADLAGVAHRFLQAADRSAKETVERVRMMIDELKMSMFCVGAPTLAALRKTPLHAVGADLA